MKNSIKLIGIIALVAVIGFGLTACDDGSGSTTTTTYTVTVNNGNGSGSYTAGANVTITATVPSGQQFTNWTVNSGGATLANANSTSTSFTMPANNVTVTANFTGGSNPNISLDGVWNENNTSGIVTINGSTGVWTQIPSSALLQSAIDKGYINVGGTFFRNLTKTGDRTWSGQQWVVTYNTSSPNVAVGNIWQNCTITISADGQTFQVNYSGSSGYNTYTRTTPPLSLDGVWNENNTSGIVTINGSTGIWTQIPSSALLQSAIDKGYINVGGTFFRNLTKTGDRTWSGQQWVVTYNTSSPNVAVGNIWQNCTITISADGQTFQVNYSGSSGYNTYTRQ